MRVKILAPTREPTIIEMPTAPRRGDHIRLLDDVLEVKRVTWPVVEFFDGDGGPECQWAEVTCDRAEDLGDDDADYTPVAQVRVEHNPVTVRVNDPLGAAIDRLITDDPAGWSTQVMARVGDQIFHLHQFSWVVDAPYETRWSPAPDFSKYLPITTERN